MNEHVLTWSANKDYFVQGIREILADTSYDHEGFDDLLSNYMETDELDWGTISNAAQTCYYAIYDEVNRRLEPTASMIDINNIENEEYIEAFDEELEMSLDIWATWK